MIFAAPMGDNTETYQPSSEIARIRNRYYVHNILNGVSFRLLAGNIITLYVLNLGADNTFVGLLSSFIHIAMLFLLVGRPLVNRYGAVRVQSVFWFLRYVMMIPVVLTVAPGISANREVTFVLVAIGVFRFHAAKGVAPAGTAELIARMNGAQPEIRLLVQGTTGEPSIFASTARRVFLAHPIAAPSVDLSGIILSALENDTILGLVRFRFLVAAIVVLLRER